MGDERGPRIEGSDLGRSDLNRSDRPEDVQASGAYDDRRPATDDISPSDGSSEAGGAEGDDRPRRRRRGRRGGRGRGRADGASRPRLSHDADGSARDVGREDFDDEPRPSSYGMRSELYADERDRGGADISARQPERRDVDRDDDAGPRHEASAEGGDSTDRVRRRRRRRRRSGDGSRLEGGRSEGSRDDRVRSADEHGADRPASGRTSDRQPANGQSRGGNRRSAAEGERQGRGERSRSGDEARRSRRSRRDRRDGTESRSPGIARGRRSDFAPVASGYDEDDEGLEFLGVEEARREPRRHESSPENDEVLVESGLNTVLDVPSWVEAIGIVIAGNLDARNRAGRGDGGRR
jgi:ribonuclease E